MELTCPKCHGPMRTYERNGVHVDQCTECRGIFLDRGELERLTDAEARWHAGAPTSAPPSAPHGSQPPHGQPQPGQPQPGQPPHGQPQPSLGAMVGEVIQQVRAQQGSGYGGQGGQRYQPPHKPRKKQSFLGELFG